MAAIVFYSRADENYSVGSINVGNTAKVAQIIQDITGGDLVEITTVENYPTDYDEMTERAKREMQEKKRPAITLKGDESAIESADTIYLGYPIWWGDMPMPVYSFLEAHDLNSKTIMPFCTHEGSGISDTPATLASLFPTATVTKGLAIKGSTAQNDEAFSRKRVSAWIDSLQH